MTQTQNPPPLLLGYIPDNGKLARRQRAAQLLEAVLDERIEPRMAINRWPEALKEPDRSMDCAYQALWHFESDEDKQQGELFYMDAQLELLRQITLYLKDGKDLPPHILKLYWTNEPVRFFYDRSPWVDSFTIARRFWQAVVRIWQQALDLCFEPG